MSLEVKSKNDVSIRLTEERWQHILLGHGELKTHKERVLEAVENPEKIVEGERNEYLAIKDFDGRKKIVVVYSEVNKEDGFIITAYITSKVEKLEKLKLIWQQ